MTSLLDLVRLARPGVRVDSIQAGKYLVVGFHCDQDDVWVALDHWPADDSVESLVGTVANMMVCCLHCDSPHCQCHNERRATAGRLRQFLGPRGFRELIENAPMAVGQP
jgi:hypothetical protein